MPILFDFDGTAFKTFVPSPGSLGINEAYYLACADIFGGQGVKVYDEIGGLNNRGPIELVTNLLAHGNREYLLRQAELFLHEQSSSLSGFVPEGLGLPLTWEGNDEVLVVAELLVRTKMRYLLTQIGERLPEGGRWPEPCTGFIEFCKESNAAGTRLGILSSGHHLFIEKCFEMYDLPCPVLITDDTMRSSLAADIPVAERTKPQTGPFRMLEREWLKKFGHKLEQDRSIFIGDGLVADGGLASNVGIPFVWFNPDRKPGDLGKNGTSISDWRELLISV